MILKTYLSSMGTQETVISAFDSMCFCKNQTINEKNVHMKLSDDKDKTNLHKVHVIHPIEMITRQDQDMFHILCLGILA